MALQAIIIILTLITGCASMSSDEKIKRSTAHYQLGISYLNDNNVQPAYVELQKALDLNPHDKEVLNALGVIHLLKFEDYPKAVEYFKRALNEDKNFSEASNNLGFAYEREERFQEAIESYKDALSNPFYKNAQKAFNNLGRAYYRIRKYDEAADAYKESIRRSSDFPLPYYCLALSYNALGRYDDAAAALKMAIGLDPDYKGDTEKFRKEIRERRLFAKGNEERDIDDLIEILNY